MATATLRGAAQTAQSGAATRPAGRWWWATHRRHRLCFAAIVVLAVAVRLPGIGRPLLGHYATKNVVYASIARNWALGRAPWWRPTVDCLVDGQRGQHLLEVPIGAYLAGSAWWLFGGSLDVWGRGISIALLAASVGLLFAMVSRWHGRPPACIAAISLAISPVAIIFGQSFTLESSVVFFTLLTWWSYDRWFSRGRPWMLCAGAIALALLLLTKIYMIVVLIPVTTMAAHTWITGYQRRRRAAAGLLSVLVAVLPAAIWCLLVPLSRSADSPVYYSLAASAAVHTLPHPLLATGAFYTRLASNVCLSGLTPVVALLACAGLLCRAWRRHAGWLAAMALLVLLLPAKFDELQYYLLVALPPLAVMAGLGWTALARRWRLGSAAVAFFAFTTVACSWRLAACRAFVTPPEDRAVLRAAEALRALAEPNEPVATLHGAAPDLLYYCNRPGWALSVNDRSFSVKLAAARCAGARWLVVAGLTDLASKPCAPALAPLAVVHEADDFRIYQLAANLLPTAKCSR